MSNLVGWSDISSTTQAPSCMCQTLDGAIIHLVRYTNKHFFYKDSAAIIHVYDI